MMFVTTRDFVTFSEPRPWVDVWRGIGRGMIDANIAQVGDTYYRFIKDEASMTIRQERSTDLTATVTGTLPTTTSEPWQLVAEHIGVGQPNPWGGTFTGGEGPTTFQDNEDPDRWYMFIDQPSYHGGQGYMSFQTDDIASAGWTATPDAQLPVSPRHGTVLPVTQAEYDALLRAYQPDAFVEAVESVAVTIRAGDQPVLPGAVTVRMGDGSTQERAVTWDDVEPAAYALPGQVVVEGTVAGAGVSARGRAVVTVTPGDVASTTHGKVTPSWVVEGESAQVIVTVRPEVERTDGLVPTGRVEVERAGEVLGTVLLEQGTVGYVLDTTGWTAGRHDITVRYQGDPTFAPSVRTVRVDVRAGEA